MLRRIPLASAAVVLPLALSLTACGSDDDKGLRRADDTAGSSASAPSGSTPAAGSTTTCDYPTDPAGAAKKVDPPPSTAAYSGQVKAKIATSVGDLHLTLDASKTPCTVNSFLSLAKQGYYDNTSCHRLGDAPGFQMLQCGDPKGDGSGGPGYTIPDELTGKETYPAGTLAMANTGQPDSGGGQFFMVFGETQLPPQYTVFGTFDSAAVKALVKVGAAGNDGVWHDGTGRPNTPVRFEKVTIG